MLAPELSAGALAAADSLVVAADDFARTASILYWQDSRPWVGAVREAADDLPPDLRSLADALTTRYAQYSPYAEFREALAGAARSADAAVSTIFTRAWEAEANSRLGYRIGPAYGEPADRLSLSDLGQLSAEAVPGRGAASSPVLIVIPFRDSAPDGQRISNLVACLLALNDQSLTRSAYRVTVVEADTTPRWSDVISQHCDNYVFARKPGEFNKSWAVNVGVMQSPGDPELLCVLDADILVDRTFIARNVGRFRRPGVGAILPYRDIWYLDDAATSAAVEQRLIERRDAPAPKNLRAFLLRRPPGGCVWARAGAFRRISGFDERYEGWGGEDNDFVFRLDIDTPLDHYRDRMLHLYHSSTARLVDGKEVNAHIPALSWQPSSRIGDPQRYETEGSRPAEPLAPPGPLSAARSG
jgi:hypothetical protein